MEQDHVPTRSKVIYTISLNVSYFIYGIGSNMLGLTLIDMANYLHVGLNEISLGLSIKSIFYSIGALICILSLNRFNRQFQSALAFMFLGIALTLIPISQNLNQYYVWKAVAGVCSAAIEISCNVWMLEIWKEANHRHMQSLNFFLSLGSILAPIITLPFLSSEDRVLKDLELNSPNEKAHNNHLVKSPLSAKYLDMVLINGDNASFSDHHLAAQTQIQIPYAIIGFIIFLTGLTINLLYLFVPYEDANKRKESFIFPVATSQKRPKASPLSLSNVYYWTVLVQCCTISCFYFAITINHNYYIQTFGVESDSHLTKTTGSYLALAYSSVLTFACFCFVFISTKLAPKLIILIDLVLMIVGNCLLLFFNDQSVLWLSIVLLAIGMSSIYPSLFSYMKQRIAVNVNVGSLIVFSSGFTLSFAYSWIEGKYIERYAHTFPLINLISLLIMIVLFAVLIVFDLYYNSRQSKLIFIKKSRNSTEDDLAPQDAYKNTHM